MSRVCFRNVYPIRTFKVMLSNVTFREYTTLKPHTAYPTDHFISGNVHYFHNLRILRLAYVMQPQLFTKELFDATFVKQRSNARRVTDNWPEWVKMMREKWANHKNVVFANAATLIIEFNVDGVAPFKAARKSGQFTPILGRLTGLRGHSGTFTFFGMKPAIVGYWFGLCEPPSRVLNDLARELITLHPTNRFMSVESGHSIVAAFDTSGVSTPSPPCSPAVRARSSSPMMGDDEPFDCIADGDDEAEIGTTDEERRRRRYASGDSDLDSTHDQVEKESKEPEIPDFTSVAVEVDRFACDAPATAKLTGRVGHSGYYSQPRCREKGEKLITGYNEKGAAIRGAVSYAPKNWDCHRRKRFDELYMAYMEAEADADNPVSNNT